MHSNERLEILARHFQILFLILKLSPGVKPGGFYFANLSFEARQGVVGSYEEFRSIQRPESRWSLHFLALCKYPIPKIPSTIIKQTAIMSVAAERA